MAEEPELDWFSRKVSQWTEAVGTFFGHTVGDYLSSIPSRIYTAWTRNLEEPANQSLNELVDRLVADGLHREIAEELRELIEAMPYPSDAIALAFMQMFILSSTLKDYLGALSNLNQQRINADLHPNLIGLDVIGRYLVQNPTEFAEVADLFARWGIPNDQRDLYLRALRQYPSITELLVLVNRELMSDTKAAEYLVSQGIVSDDAWDLLELRKFHPSPTDIVSLAGREAFEEDAISQFQLDRDMPEEMFEEARKAGVPDKVMRWYWVAHWQNPSLGQVFEMLHRDVKKPDGSTFDQSDLDVFYRLADVNPYFGDLLRQIAYRPYTRVDTRRMYEMGVLDRSEVKRAYLDQGYDDEHAEKMTQFTVAFVEDKQRDLTKPQLDKAYELGQLDRAEYLERMEGLGYDPLEADWLLGLLQAELEEKRVRSRLRRLEYQYKRGMVDEVEVSESLAGLGYKGDRADELVADWDSEELVEQALPTKVDLIGWLGEQKLTEEEFRSKMRRRRYSDDDIDLYLGEAGQKLTRAELVRFLREGRIDVGEAQLGLRKLGYKERVVELYLRAAATGR